MSKFNLGSSIVLKIDGINTSQINYPNVGQLMEIENRKMSLTDGKYVEYVASPMKTRSMRFLIDLVDTLSHFSVLVPDLTKKLSVDTYLDIDPITAKSLVEVYQEQFIPWYSELLKVMYNIVEEDQQDRAEESQKTGSEE